MTILTRAARQAQPSEENDAVVPAKGGLAKGKALPLATKRRALGDVSNIVANDRGLKDSKSAEPAPKGKTSAAAKTSDNAQGPQINEEPRPSSAGPVVQAPRTRSQTLAVKLSTGGGTSMTALLESRSAAAAGSRRTSGASPVPDIDRADKGNPLAAADYVSDIYSYYRQAEVKYRVAPNYMSLQADINERMRSILVDWLVEVHLKFKLMPESLYLTVNLIDRFLELVQVKRKNLQLVGVTAMLIASKYEEIWAPSVKDFVYICDKAYDKEQILAMEKLMLNTLGFKLTLPTQYNFQARFIKAANMHLDSHVTMLTSYLLELSLVDAPMLAFPYSLISAAAAHVALRALNKPNAYPKALAQHSGYTKEQVQPCAAALVQLMQAAPTQTLTAVHKKYSSLKCLEITKTEVPVKILREL